MAMTADEFRKIVVDATNQFLHGVPYRAGAPFRIQFPLEGGPFLNVVMQLAIGLAEDLEDGRET
jgi:hypothetical protein